MKNLSLLVPLCLAAATVEGQDRYEQALTLPKRTENLVFRDRLRAYWLPDGKSFWYRIQTGPKTHEFVLINADTGERKTAQSLKELGLHEKEALKSSTAKIELRRTKRTGEESGLKFINQLDADVDPYLILGACNPPLAHRALTAEPSLGLLLPCNVVVRSTDAGTVVEAIDPMTMVQFTGNPDLQAVADEATATLSAASDTLR